MQKYEDRILFLKDFTRELIINSRKPGTLIMPQYSPLPYTPIEEEKIYVPLVTNPIRNKSIDISNVSNRLPKRPRFIPRPMQPPRQMPPQIQPISQSFDLGKLNFLLKDSRVTIIECPGPEKPVLTRVNGRQLATNVNLTEEEIKQVVNKFSEESKIPIIGGLFKVAVGNLIITSVISDVVGSRFIITKITPQFIIEQTEKTNQTG